MNNKRKMEKKSLKEIKKKSLGYCLGVEFELSISAFS
jgi:hypothetical protein